MIPNPWDIGSARALAALGFQALATTSAGCAWAAGEPDHGVTLPSLLDHLRVIAGSVDLPVTADFENGLADDPADVAANVTAAIATGIADETGRSIVQGPVRVSTGSGVIGSGQVAQVQTPLGPVTDSATLSRVRFQVEGASLAE